MAKTDLTLARARELLAYDECSGALVSRTSRSKAKAGQEAGYVNPNGYRYLKVDGRAYVAHRLVWLLAHGTFPEEAIDHIDGDRLNNRLSNLRLCSGGIVNAHNQRRAQRGSKSGVLGVSWRARDGNWRASIRINGKLYGLGYFQTIEEAAAAYQTARAALHPASPEYAGASYRLRDPMDPYRTSSSGVRGVCWSKKAGKWKAQANINGRRTCIGYFEDKHVAGQAYLAAIKPG